MQSYLFFFQSFRSKILFRIILLNDVFLKPGLRKNSDTSEFFEDVGIFAISPFAELIAIEGKTFTDGFGGRVHSSEVITGLQRHSHDYQSCDGHTTSLYLQVERRGFGKSEINVSHNFTSF